MKKITLIIALAFAGITFAQDSSLPLDFEAAEDTYQLFDFGGLQRSVIANPDTNGNPSAQVLSISKPAAAETFAGIALPQSSPLDISESTIITMLVWSPVAGTTFTLKVEEEGAAADPNDGNFFTQVTMTGSVAAGWETLSFDISNPDPGTFEADNDYINVVLFPNLNMPGTAEDNTFFIDNIQVEGQLSVGENANIELNLFPNPTTAQLNVQAKTAIQSVAIYNLLGQEVRSFEGTGTSTSVNVQELLAGTYIAQVQTAEGTSALRFIKQ